MDKRDEIIKILTSLFDVEPSPEEETVLFKNVKHDELLLSVEYWIDQSKMIFGEVVHIEKTQSLADAGVDICVNLVQSKFRFGIQVKSHFDIGEKAFAKNVKAQTYDSSSFSLDKYVILFAADLTKQWKKVQGMISTLSQNNTDQHLLLISPAKFLTIFKAHKNNIHPMKLVFLDALNLGKILGALADNLNYRNREVKIDSKIEYHVDSAEHPESFKMKYSFDKKEIEKIKVQDELEHINITDEVVQMKKGDYDKLIVTDKTGDSSPDEILVWQEKPNRIFMQLQSLSKDIRVLGEYSELIDIKREDNLLEFKAKDTKKPLQFSFEINVNTGKGKFFFNTRYNGFSIDDLYEMMMFLIQIRNAASLRLHVPADNVTQIIPVQDPIQIDLPSGLIDLIFKLYLLQTFSGFKFTLVVESDESTAELHYIVNILVSLYFVHKLTSRNIMHVDIKLPRAKALELLKKYKENKINQEDVIRTSYTADVLNYEITVPNVDIILSEFHPVTDISELEKGMKPEYEIKLEANQSNSLA